MTRSGRLSFFVCGLVALSGACDSGSGESRPRKVLLLTNNSDLDRSDEPFILTREDLESYFGPLPSGGVPRLTDAQGQALPSQTDDLDGDKIWDELAFVHSLETGATVSVQVDFVEPDEMPSYPPRTQVHLGARPSAEEPISPVTFASFQGTEIPPYQVYQTDGPSWENGLVGFRLYLDGRNTRDVFGKRTSDLVLHEVGVSADGAPVDNYHFLADWGRDVLECGRTLGAGSIAIVTGEGLIRLGRVASETTDNIDETIYRLINSGPVRGIFEVSYTNWHVGDETYDLRVIVSIWAGSYAYENKLWLTGFEGQRSLVIGLANNNNSNPVVTQTYGSEFAGILTHDKQTYNKEHYLGLALVVPNENLQEWAEAPKSGAGIVTSSYASLTVASGEPITYRVFAGWELQEDRFQDAEKFGQMVGESVTRLGAPVDVSAEVVP